MITLHQWKSTSQCLNEVSFSARLDKMARQRLADLPESSPFPGWNSFGVCRHACPAWGRQQAMQRFNPGPEVGVGKGEMGEDTFNCTCYSSLSRGEAIYSKHQLLLNPQTPQVWRSCGIWWEKHAESRKSKKQRLWISTAKFGNALGWCFWETTKHIDRAKDENDNRTNGIIEVAGAQAADNCFREDVRFMCSQGCANQNDSQT